MLYSESGLDALCEIHHTVLLVDREKFLTLSMDVLRNIAKSLVLSYLHNPDSELLFQAYLVCRMPLAKEDWETEKHIYQPRQL